MDFKNCSLVVQVIIVSWLVESISLGIASINASGGSDEPKVVDDTTPKDSLSLNDKNSTTEVQTQKLTLVEEVQRALGCRVSIANKSEFVIANGLTGEVTSSRRHRGRIGFALAFKLVLNAIDLMISQESPLAPVPTSTVANSNAASASIVSTIFEKLDEPLLKEYVRVQYTSTFMKCMEQLSEDKLFYLAGITDATTITQDVLKIMEIAIVGNEEDVLKSYITMLIKTLPTILRLLPITEFNENVKKFSVEMKVWTGQLGLDGSHIPAIINSITKFTPGTLWSSLKSCFSLGKLTFSNFSGYIRNSQLVRRASLIWGTVPRSKSIRTSKASLDEHPAVDESTGTAATAPKVTAAEPVVTETSTRDGELVDIIMRRQKDAKDRENMSALLEGPSKIFIQTIQSVLFGSSKAHTTGTTYTKIKLLPEVPKELAMFFFKIILANKISDEFGKIVGGLDKSKIEILARQLTTTITPLDKLEAIYISVVNSPSIMINILKDVPAALLVEKVIKKIVERRTAGTPKAQSTDPGIASDTTETQDIIQNKLSEILGYAIAENTGDGLLSTIT